MVWGGGKVGWYGEEEEWDGMGRRRGVAKHAAILLFAVCLQALLPTLPAHTPETLGLNDFDVEGIRPVQRLVMWKAPPPLCAPQTEQANRKSGSWNLLYNVQEPQGEMLVFTLDQCATEALVGECIQSHTYRVSIPLTHLVPDILLTDLPQDLKVDYSQFEFNSKDPTSVLGRGGSGNTKMHISPVMMVQSLSSCMCSCVCNFLRICTFVLA